MQESLIKVAIGFIWDKGLVAIYNRLSKKKHSVDELKKITRVLFVDDESSDSLLRAITDAGWNVRQITDITNINDEVVRTADIIFMDYKGVGSILTPTQEGIGLMKHIKRNYPEKHIIFYSGHAGFIPGHEVHGLADEWMQKHADPFEYIDRIEASAREIYG